MKKLLTAVGLLTIGAPTTLSVVACGTTTDIIKPSWDLSAYNDGREHKIWVERNDLESLDKLELTKLFWTGILDSDDKDGDHARQMERFNNQEVEKHLDIINNADIISQIKDSEDELATLSIKDIQIKLDKDLNSKTDQDNPKDYTLKASEATWEEITVIFTKNGIERSKLNQVIEDFNHFLGNIVTLDEEPESAKAVVLWLLQDKFFEYITSKYGDLSLRIAFLFSPGGIKLDKQERKISNVKIQVLVDYKKDNEFELTRVENITINYEVIN